MDDLTDKEKFIAGHLFTAAKNFHTAYRFDKDDNIILKRLYMHKNDHWDFYCLVPIVTELGFVADISFLSQKVMSHHFGFTDIRFREGDQPS